MALQLSDRSLVKVKIMCQGQLQGKINSAYNYAGIDLVFGIQTHIMELKLLYQGQRSNVRKKYIAYNYACITSTDLIFGMLTYFIEMQLLDRVWSRSRSHIKVIGQIKTLTLSLTLQILQFQIFGMHKHLNGLQCIGRV